MNIHENGVRIGWAGSEDLCFHEPCEQRVREKYKHQVGRASTRWEFTEHGIDAIVGDRRWRCCGCGELLRGSLGEHRVETMHFL